MKPFKVSFTRVVSFSVEAYVNAISENDAIEMIKRGECLQEDETFNCVIDETNFTVKEDSEED